MHEFYRTNTQSANQFFLPAVRRTASNQRRYNASHGTLALRCTPLEFSYFSLVSRDKDVSSQFQEKVQEEKKMDNVALSLHNKSSVFSLASM